ncbi:MAG: hypothetical protein FWG85_07105 [Bacteroidetes bacterium]|nr:hypothetical protein [Bacteroidota bacterium]
MIKKIITTIILILFTASSSGVVVFAFECTCKYNHSHYSIYQKTTCNDTANTHNDCGCCCDDEVNNNHYHNKTTNIIDNCGFHKIKILSLGIAIDINKKNIEKKIIHNNTTTPNFANKKINNIINSLTNNYIKKPPPFYDISMIIVKYIQTISSKTSDEVPILVS